MTISTGPVAATDAFRCLIDTNILDKIVEHEHTLARVRDLSSRGKLDLVTTSVTERQIMRIENPDKRAQLNAVPRSRIGTAGFVLDYSWLDVDRIGLEGPIEAIRKGREKETEDALIAATAEFDGLILVTEDQRLLRAVGRRGITVWDWAALRLRIGSL